MGGATSKPASDVVWLTLVGVTYITYRYDVKREILAVPKIASSDLMSNI